MEKSVKKTEKQAIIYIEEMISKIKNLDCNIPKEDTGISWDGYIDLFKNENIDKKENFVSRLPIQVKGRTHKLKKLERKIKFDIDIEDLKNYKKVDGTILFVVKIKENNEAKVYYRSLLPSNINTILEENKHNPKKVKIELWEIKDIKHFERICVDFYADKETQKKLSSEVFNNDYLSVNGKMMATFNHYSKNNIPMYDLLGEERNIYIKSDNEIIGVQCFEIDKIGTTVNLNISFGEEHIYYRTYKYEKDIDGNENILFGKSFVLNMLTKKLNITIRGTLNERIQDLKFICMLSERKYFYINTIKFNFDFEKEKIDKYKNMLSSLEKIKMFCEYLKIKKDINLDEWREEEYKKIFLWISAIIDKKTINAPNWELDSIGSILVGDLRFSIMTTRDKEDEFFINAIWDESLIGKQSYKYQSGETEIYTNNLFSVLNADVYRADDVDIVQMMKYFDSYQLQDNEETLINLQALEVLKAYDITKNIELLNYAEFLLNKIINFQTIEEVVKINLMQIKKRRNQELNEQELSSMIEIRNNNKGNNMFLLAVATIMENKAEINYIFKNMTEIEKQEFKNFPIYTLMEEVIKQ